VRHSLLFIFSLTGILFLSAHGGGVLRSGAVKEPLTLVVMDPLAAQLACACVAGYAQRDYAQLSGFLETELRRPVSLVFAESLNDPLFQTLKKPDLVIGKHSVVKADAAKLNMPLRTLAMLSDSTGSLSLTGLFVVRQTDPAKSIADIKTHRLLFGPEEAIEKHAAALSSLEAFGIPRPGKIVTSPGCSSAAIAVIENEADCTVVSSYAMPLLKGCGSIAKDELRIIGKTDPVPFVTVFIDAAAGKAEEQAVLNALLEANKSRKLLNAMESRDGFVPLPPAFPDGRDWPDWRGRGRHAISKDVPERLPETARLLWSRVMTGSGMAGLSASGGVVLVSDKSADETCDIFHCLDADTGIEKWRIEYPAKGEMDFTNSPRATPVMRDGRVCLLGAFGDLFCAELETGAILWRKNLPRDFSAEVPTWGFCSTPLITGGKLIINPGTRDASLAALDRLTGEILWQTPGELPGYASFIEAAPHGIRQIIGYDAVSAGGWDPETGKRLWKMVPLHSGDFNVPTPIMIGDRLLLSTENNGTRLYDFDENGILIGTPAASSEELNPDTSTPVVHDGLVFGNWSGLVCLDAKTLSLQWATEGGPLADYCSLIAGNSRVLAATQTGELILAKTDRNKFSAVSRINLFADVPNTEKDVWSHPVLLGHRLYIRNSLAAYCFLLE